jgi:hypothetical protein
MMIQCDLLKVKLTDEILRLSEVSFATYHLVEVCMIDGFVFKIVEVLYSDYIVY